MKNLLALLFGGLLMVATTQGHAETNSVAGLLAEMKLIYNKIDGLKAEKVKVLRLNITPAKKTALWDAQLKTRIYPKLAIISTHITELKIKKKKYNKIISDSNKGCTGNKSQAVYDRCLAAKRYHDTLRADFAKHYARVKKERDAVGKEELSYATLIRKNNAQIQRNEKTAARLQTKINNNVAILDRYRQRLIVECSYANTADSSRTTNEALHYCHSINWDGKNGTLPPLDEIFSGTQFFRR